MEGLPEANNDWILRTSDDGVVTIGSDRQLFIDDFVVESHEGIQFRPHRPVQQEIVMRFDQPWEGSTSMGPVVSRDEHRYRMWYRVSAEDDVSTFFTAYAESLDGINWQRPETNAFGTNICITDKRMGNAGFFIDDNPEARSERFKAVGRNVDTDPHEIFGMVSSDGLDWELVDEEPLCIAPDQDPKFDSPPCAFWDPLEEEYKMFARGWFPDADNKQVRSVRMTASGDFTEWKPWEYIDIGTEEWREHFYTNPTTLYHRAPVYLMFPMRYHPERTISPEAEQEGLSDILMLASRDGRNWVEPYREAFLWPGPDQKNWRYHGIYMGPSVVETPDEMLSFYVIQNYRTSTNHIRRLTLRKDGFISAHATRLTGELTTKLLSHEGDRLEVNYSTSAGGSVKVAILDDQGNELPGYSSDMCILIGDETDHLVEWEGSESTIRATDGPIRIKFELNEADLYSFRFQ